MAKVATFPLGEGADVKTVSSKRASLTEQTVTYNSWGRRGAKRSKKDGPRRNGGILKAWRYEGSVLFPPRLTKCTEISGEAKI